MYEYDWLGLKELNEAGKIEFLVMPGQHMHFVPSSIAEYIGTYIID